MRRDNGQDGAGGGDRGVYGDAPEMVGWVKRRIDSAGRDEFDGAVAAEALAVENGGAADEAEEVIRSGRGFALGRGERD